MTITTEEIPITDAYHNIEKMIHQICNKFQYKFGGDIDDLLSEANRAFIRAYKNHDPERGKLITLVHHAVTNQLKLFSMRNYQRESKRPKTLTNWRWSFMTTKNEKFNWETFTKHLSDDAKFVVHLILEEPNDIEQLVQIIGKSKKNWIKVLKSHLMDIGWSVGRIRDSFREVRRTL